MSSGTVRPCPRRRPALAAAVALALLTLPAAATAQYRDAGSDADILPSRRVLLQEAVEQARWRLGNLRVAPWIGLRDVSYVRGERRSQGTGEDTDGGQSDLTATAGAGFKAYLPMGKAILALHALPEYSWWQEQDERNAVVGRYGAGFFGYFNRLETEIMARRVEDVGFLSSDLLVRQPVRNEGGEANVQLRLGAATALFASATTDRIRVESPAGLAPDETSVILDRDSTSWRGGVRYLLRGDLGHFGAGVQGEETEFLGPGDRRSNEGTGWYAEALVQGNKLSVGLDYAQRELEPTAGSTFPGYEEGTGNALLSFHPTDRFRVNAYARRELRYSAVAVDRFFEENRTGLGVGMTLWRGNALLFYEIGENRFFGASAVTPSEDVTAYGITYDLPIGEYLAMRLGTRTTRYEPENGLDREVREVIGGLALTLGSKRGEW